MELLSYPTFPQLFNLQFQAWALPSLIATVVNSALAVLIWRKSTRDLASQLYIFTLFAAIVWGIGEFMERSSASEETAFFWGDIAIFGPTFIGILFFAFTLVLIERGLLFENLVAVFLLIVPAFAFLFLLLNTDIIAIHDLERVSWGWFPLPGPLFPAYIVWVVAFFVISFFLLARRYVQIQEKQKKKQILFILVGISVPLVGGVVFDALFPVLRINLPGMAVVFTSFFAVMVSYAILRYKLFIVSPALALSTVINSMSESLIVLNRSHVIELVNKTALATLGYQEHELIGEQVKKIIAPIVWASFEENCLKEFTVSSGEVIHYESELFSKDTKRISVRFSISPLKGPSKETIGIIVLAFDITHQKKLLEDLRRTTEEFQMVQYNLEKKLSKIEGLER